MPTEQDELHAATADELMEPFEPATLEQWRAAAEKALRGGGLESLGSTTLEGVELQPLYRQQDVRGVAHLGGLPGQAPFVRGAAAARRRAWLLCSELNLPGAAELGQAAREELAGGAEALELVLDAAAAAGLDADSEGAGELVGQGGLQLSHAGDLKRALSGVDLSRVPLTLRAGGSALAAGALLCAVAGERGAPPEALQGSLGLDPLGTLASGGELPVDLDTLWDEMAELMVWARQHAPGLRVTLVRAEPYHDGGGHAVHELGFAMATAAEVLGAMTDRGLGAGEAAARLSFSFAAGPRLLTEVAKLRAARLLWSQVAGAFGCQDEARAAWIHAGSSGWQWSTRDVWVNILRGTAGAFAGVVGGADSVSVSPYDRSLGLPAAMARRLARGTQLVLREEAQLARVMDPAGGAWAVELLTDQLARQAWGLLQRVEALGGMAAALRQGFPQQEVARLAARRQAAIARGEQPAVGVTHQALVDEQRPEPGVADLEALRLERTAALGALRASRGDDLLRPRLEAIGRGPGPGERMSAAIDAARAGATLGELCRALRGTAGAPEQVQPIPARRAGEAFERLRDAADALPRPRALLLHLAPPAGHRPRADFAAGFMTLGGFAVSELEAPADPAEAAAAAQQDAPAVVVLCAPDARYAELAPALLQALRARGPGRPLVLAGRPRDQLEALTAAGVDHFIHQGSDRVAVLSSLQQALGVG